MPCLASVHLSEKVLGGKRLCMPVAKLLNSKHFSRLHIFVVDAKSTIRIDS